MGAAENNENDENKRLLRDVFAELAVGRIGAMGAAMADDCRWVFPGEWSWSGVWEPKRVVLDELLRPLMAQFDGRYRSEADLIVAEGDRVVVQARGMATTKRGEAYNQTYCYVFRVRDGQLTEIIEHCDTALVERVLDPPALRPTSVRRSPMMTRRSEPPQMQPGRPGSRPSGA